MDPIPNGFQRPLPKLLYFSDAKVKLVVAFVLLSNCYVIFQSAYQQNIIHQNRLEALDHVSIEGEVRYYLRADLSRYSGARFIGVSLSAEFMFLLENVSNTSIVPYGSKQPITISIDGVNCTGHSKKRNTFSGDMTLVSRRLALIWPVDCSAYGIALNASRLGLHEENATSCPLTLERGMASVSNIGVVIRLFMSMFFTALTVYSILSWVKLRRRYGSWIAKYSPILCNVAVVLMCNPTDCIRLINWNWTALVCRWVVPVSPLVGTWGRVIYQSEVLADLSRAEHAGELRVPAQSATMLQIVAFAKVTVLIAPIILVSLVSTVSAITLANLQSQSFVALAEYDMSWRPRAVFGIVYLGYVVASIVQGCKWYFRMKRMPYSRCRVHYTLFSFNLLGMLSAEIVIFLSFGIGIVSFVTLRTGSWMPPGPWMEFDALCLGMLLPDTQPTSGGERNDLDALVTALLMTFCLTCVEPVSHPDSNWRSPAAPNRLCDTALTDPLAVDAADLGTSMTSISPTEVPRPGEHRRTRIPALSLYDVRILAHIALCHLVGTEAETLATKRGPPGAEDDLDLSSIKFVKAVTNEAMDLHAMLVTVYLPGIAHDVTVVSFRGTSNMKNVKTDLNSLMAPLEIPSLVRIAESVGIAEHRHRMESVRVHQGFQEAYMAIREDLLYAVHSLRMDCALCIGHSLGGALATFLAAELNSDTSLDCPVGLCTFGSPRVGNTAFARLVDYAVDASVRVVLGNDPVARVPPQIGGACGRVYCPRRQFKHVSGLVRVFPNGHLVVQPSLLEELLRVLTRRCLLRNCCYCCVWLSRAPSHRLYWYLAAFRAAQALENTRIPECTQQGDICGTAALVGQACQIHSAGVDMSNTDSKRDRIIE